MRSWIITIGVFLVTGIISWTLCVAAGEADKNFKQKNDDEFRQ